MTNIFSWISADSAIYLFSGGARRRAGGTGSKIQPSYKLNWKIEMGPCFFNNKKWYHFVNPLTSTRHFTYVCFWDFLTNLFFNRFLCKFYTGEQCPSFICCKKQKQLIIYTTHFMSSYVPKSRFSAKKGVHCSGALLKKQKRFSLYFLNG